jgi:YfiH family protein
MARVRMRDQGSIIDSFHRNPPYTSSLSKISALDLADLLWVREGVPSFRYPKLLIQTSLVHRVFTRHGGVSDAPYDRLNISYMVGDRPENVTENLRKIRGIVDAANLVYMNQLHGNGILVLREGDFTTSDEAPSADALITNTPRLALMVKQADCQAVVLFDTEKEVVAIVHCGWRGNVRNILGRVIALMKQEFGCEGSDLLAAISPSLGPCCAEFVSHKKIFPQSFNRFMVGKNYFDLWSLSCSQLVEAGLREENIELAAICTRCRTDLFFSYRGDGTTGRFATVAMLR